MSDFVGVSTGWGDVVSLAKEADKTLDSMVRKSEEISRNLRNAFSQQGQGGFFDLINKAQGGLIEALDFKSENANASKLLKTFYNLSEIMSKMAGENKDLFDPTRIYESTKGIGKLEEELLSIQTAIRNLKSEYMSLSGVQKVLSDTNSNEDAVTEARKEALEVFAERGLQISEEASNEEIIIQAKVEQAKIDSLRKILKEQERIAAETLRFNGATAAEQQKMIEKKNNEIIRDEKRAAKEVRDAQKERYSTPEGAIAFSNAAKTEEQEVQAIKYLIEARKKLSYEDEKYIEIRDELNKRIEKHRISVEQATKAEQNEQTLQPKIANEYARLLVEIDKLIAAKEKLSQTDAYKSNTPEATQDMQAMEARLNDLNDRRLEIEESAQGQLDEIYRKHEANRAVESVNAIEKTEREKAKKMEEFAKKYATITSTDALASVTQSQNTKNIAQAEKSIQDLKIARDKLDNTDANYTQTVNTLNAEIKRQEEYIESVTRAEEHQKKQEEEYNHSKDGAMAYAERAKSVGELKKAIDYLQSAMEKEDITTNDGKKNYRELQEELEKTRIKYNKLEGENKKFINSLGQVGNRIASAFSIAAITKYVNEVIKIRKEFERQQVALQAIIQDMDKANQIWDKTIALAVKSPFTVKQLVTYTKQLAAYRIETDKLYDTTKMLADVSAGLGVDMDRLILAYGQVRAASYLRGTELRQFTEAGIPLLDELAARFTELEGRAYSVGDVFEMISKRMVSFEDVAAVFNNMTKEGGIFYRMQEIQAETLYGQLSNLRDALDIMFNEIGKANDGTLKNFVKGLRNILSNYKDIIDIVKAWSIALSPLAAKILLTKVATSGLGTSLFNLITNTKLGLNIFAKLEVMLINLSKKSAVLGSMMSGLSKMLGGLATAGVWVGVFYLVKWLSSAYLKMTEVNRVAKRLRKSLEEIFIEDTNNLDKSIDSYENLVARLREANEGSSERREIIRRLNSEYGEYLDFIVDENTTVQQLTDSYDSLVKSMKEKSAYNTYQKGLAEIEESYSKLLQNAKDSFYDLFYGKSIRVEGDNVSELFRAIIPTREEIDDIYSILLQKVEELDSKSLDSLSSQQKLLQEIVKGYYGDEFYLAKDYGKSVELINILVDKKKKEEELQDEINARYKETLKSREANVAYQKLENEYKEKQVKIQKEANLSDFEIRKKLSELKQQFELDKIELKFTFGEISETEMNAQKDRIINWATETTKSVNEAINTKLGKIFSEEELSKVLITQKNQADKINGMIEEIKTNWEEQNKIIAESISLKSAGIKVDEKLLSRAERLKYLYEEVAKILGIELKETRRLSEEMRAAINDAIPEEYAITLVEAYSGIDAIISKLNTDEQKQVNIINQLNKAKKEGLYYSDEELKKIDEELKKAEETYYWIKLKQSLIDPSSKTRIKSSRVQEINNKLEEEYQLNSIDRQKTEVELLNEASSKKDEAIAKEEQLLNMREKGLTVSEEELALAKKDIEQWTLRWELLGGKEKEEKTSTRTNSLYDERLKVIDDMNKKYNELNKTLSKSESLQGAFEAYIDAFSTAFAGIKWIPKNVRKMSAEEFTSKVLNFPDENALVAFLDKLSKEPMKTFEKIKVELAKGDYVYDIKVNAKLESDKDLKKQVEDMFDQYDLTLELKELDIPQDLAKNLFNVDYTSLDDLREKLVSMRESFIGKDMLDEYDKFMEKLNDMEIKAAKERMKTYSKYLMEGMSERVKITVDGLKKIKEVEQSSEFDEYQKKRIKEGISKDARAELQKQQWEEFKNTDIYTMMFDDIENMGTTALTALRDRLKELKYSLKDLPTAELRRMATQLSKIEEEIAVRNPFKALADSMRKIKELKSMGLTEDVLQAQFVQSESLKASYQEELDNVNLIISKYDDKVAIQQLSQVEEGKYAKYLGMSKEELEEMSSTLSGNIVIQDDILDRLLRQLGIYSDAERNADAVEKTWNNILSLTKKAYSSISDILDTVDADAYGISQEVVDTTFSLAEGVMQMVSLSRQIAAGTEMVKIFGVEMKVALGPLGYILIALGIVARILKAIFSIKSKNIQRQLDLQSRQIEKLQRSYENLEEAIDKAWSTDQMVDYYDQMKKNIELQIQSTKSAIAALSTDKKSSKVGTDEWKQLQDLLQQLNDLQKQLEEVDEQAFDTFTDGVLSNVMDAASGFTESWLDAFNETGDGLDGLEENFEDMLKNIATKQAAMMITGQYVERWKEALNNFTDDGKLSPSEIEQWAKGVRDDFPELNDALKAYFEAIKGVIGGGNNLSGLTTGTQGMTEEQADILAAYWNSVRQYTASIDEKMSGIIQGLNFNNEANPVISQLKIIARQTNNIYDLLDGLTASYPNGGRGFKIIMSD